MINIPTTDGSFVYKEAKGAWCIRCLSYWGWPRAPKREIDEVPRRLSTGSWSIHLMPDDTLEVHASARRPAMMQHALDAGRVLLLGLLGTRGGEVQLDDPLAVAVDTETGERGDLGPVRDPDPPARPLDADRLVAVHGGRDAVDPVAEATDQAGEAGHVGVGAWDDERALVAVTVVRGTKVVLGVDDEDV